ncbi:uncharacterized protein LOC131640300 [Vicia villosa]|uniref:uncharacterized protein LOC131640300 n=1 Tax=Vicia villosa TaxID=3911 RepID=UPI00273B9A6B|nr:uncharacterized protein LOC131640300 [Vicia villosa]
MHEIGIPRLFTKKIMAIVKCVTYVFNVNGGVSETMQAYREIRQGDPISPLLFVITMEYLNRLLHSMQLNANLNHHSKCEKLSLTNFIFVDEILLFCRGDTRSVEMMMETVDRFSASTGLIINRGKCKSYPREVHEKIEQEIKVTTKFEEVKPPFRYLEAPLSSKKLNIILYLPLIDRIVRRIQHWTSKLLSYAGRIQLVKSITFVVTQYWMHYFPIPKAVIHKIEAIGRSFIWSGSHDVTRKSHVAWRTVCRPYSQGSLNIINMGV